MVEDVATYSDDSVDAFLSHYGVKGMKWGVRKSGSSADGKREGPIARLKKSLQGPDGPEDVTVTTQPGRKVKTAGGRGRSASEDAVKAATARQIAKKSSTDSLSNAELQSLVTRMNLEQQYSTLSAKNMTAGQKFVKGLVGEGTKVADQEAKKRMRQMAIKFAAAAVV